ncbi:unnamed protein product [Moneuplotes crassus]|uniref:Uncharacterized protein n=2 Tax=Euplotes crassus TaxID=5936 RepID=A0AAD1UK14_EUPCR|nr:unnamed protein product [Moneuplotes crassus]
MEKIRDQVNNTSFGPKGYLTIKQEIAKQHKIDSSRLRRYQWIEKVRTSKNLQKLLHVKSAKYNISRKESHSLSHPKGKKKLGPLKKVSTVSFKSPSSVDPFQRSVDFQKREKSWKEPKLNTRKSLVLSGTKFFAVAKESMEIEDQDTPGGLQNSMIPKNGKELMSLKMPLGVDNSPISPGKISVRESFSIVKPGLPKMPVISEQAYQEAEDSCSDIASTKKYKRAKSISKANIKKFPNFNKTVKRKEGATSRSIMIETDNLLDNTGTDRTANYDSLREFHNRTISQQDLKPVEKGYSESVLKAFKHLQDPPVMPSYLKTKLKLRHNLMSMLNKDSFDSSMKNPTQASLLSVSEIQDKIEHAQKQKLIEYVSKKKLYMKSMLHCD